MGESLEPLSLWGSRQYRDYTVFMFLGDGTLAADQFHAEFLFQGGGGNDIQTH